MITGPRKRPTNPNDWMPPENSDQHQQEGQLRRSPDQRWLNEIVTDQQRPRAKDKQCSRHQTMCRLEAPRPGRRHQAPATPQMAPSAKRDGQET